MAQMLLPPKKRLMVAAALVVMAAMMVAACVCVVDKPPVQIILRSLFGVAACTRAKGNALRIQRVFCTLANAAADHHIRAVFF